MYCNKCKNEIAENVKFCPYCGSKVEKNDVEIPQEEVISNDKSHENSIEVKTIQNDNEKIEKKKKRRSITRLVIGIVSMVISLFILLQSCATGLYNTISSTGDLGGTAGFLVFALILAAGIVSVAGRKSEKKGTSIVISILYFISAFIAFPNSTVFTDLKVWGVMCVLFGLYFISDVLPEPKNDDSDNEPFVDIKCNNCGTVVRLNDTVCPNCGAKITNTSKTISVIKTIGNVILGLMVISVIVYTITSSIIEKKEIKESTSIPISDITVQSEEYDDSSNTDDEMGYITDVGTVFEFLESDYFMYDGDVISIFGEFDMDRNGDMYLYGNNGRILLQGLTEEDANAIFNNGGCTTVVGQFYIDTYGLLNIDVFDSVE